MILGAMTVMGVLLANTESRRTLSVRWFTALSQQMLTAIKYVTYEIFFCFQQDSTLAHHACNTVKLQEHELSTSLLLTMAFNLKSSVVRAADYEIQRFTY